MGSRDALIVAIREKIDYEALFGEFIELRGRGSERTARCIFHDDQSPSMSVNVENGRWCCHTPDCGAKGDEFDFYQRVRSLTFKEAVDEIARRVGLDPDRFLSRPAVGEGTDATSIAQRQEQLLATFVPGQTQQPTHPARQQEPDPDQYIDEAVVDAMHQRLLTTQERIDWLANRRGYSLDTIRQFKLGFDGQRYYIPVRDAEGRCVNIRRYKPDARRSQDKMISWRQGFGTARLFPLWLMNDEQPVLLLEGETDCMLARQLGMNAVTTTGGAGTWRDSWNALFQDHDVVICYDNDEAGAKGANHVAAQLFGIARSIKIVRIPLAEPKGADFTDYIVGHGHSIDDFKLLIEHAQPFTVLNARAAQSDPITPDDTDEDVPLVHLSKASNAEFYNKPVKFSVRVSGKTTSPFLAPKQVMFHSCGLPGLKMCNRCAIGRAGDPDRNPTPTPDEAAGRLVRSMEFKNNEALELINVPNAILERNLKAQVGIPVTCGYIKIEPEKAANIEEINMIPDISRSDEENPYVTRNGFYVIPENGEGACKPLKANASYIMTAITVPDPKRQLTTHIITSAVEAKSSIDAFCLTDDVVSRLKVFQPTEPGVRGLWKHMGFIYDDLERFLRIYQRRDIILATDLVFHSVIRFKFQGELLVRGWMEALIIGDSRTGKTSVVQRMVDYYDAGEFTTGENTTLAGLVGGLHQIGTSWALQWGRIPLNDRHLLVIDEAGNLPHEQISRMSSMRSSGIAEVIKVHTERTNARTRSLWISNPRSPRPLSSFSQGVLAVKELIGAPEDVARFDFVVSAASGDVPLAVVNAAREQQQPEIFSRELCHQRVMWAWSRLSDDIVWDGDSTSEVLRLATEHGEKYRYATEIPLVEPNEQRIKLARASVATAALFFSASDDGQQIIVKPEHVQFAAQFMETLYTKPSLAFAEYAENARRRYTIGNADRIDLIMRRNAAAIPALMEQEQFTQRDLEEILAIDDRRELRSIVAELKEAGFLRRIGSSFYVKTPAAIQWLRLKLAGGSVEQLDFQTLAHATVPTEPPF